MKGALARQLVPKVNLEIANQQVISLNLERYFPGEGGEGLSAAAEEG
jgi:hypothetical protein